MKWPTWLLYMMADDSSSSDDGLPSISIRAKCAELAARALLTHSEDLIVLGSKPAPSTSTSSRSAAAIASSSRPAPVSEEKRNVSERTSNGREVPGKRSRPKADAGKSPGERMKRKREEALVSHKFSAPYQSVLFFRLDIKLKHYYYFQGG